MNPEEVENAVAYVTNQRPPTDDERAKLARGDAMLMAVICTKHNKRGQPLLDKWNDNEPPIEKPRKGYGVDTTLSKETARQQLEEKGYIQFYVPGHLITRARGIINSFDLSSEKVGMEGHLTIIRSTLPIEERNYKGRGASIIRINLNNLEQLTDETLSTLLSALTNEYHRRENA